MTSLVDGASTPPDHRSGFVSLVGRPNAGKSTLTNALVGEKVAITSSKPQTTRHTIRKMPMKPPCAPSKNAALVSPSLGCWACCWSSA